MPGFAENGANVSTQGVAQGRDHSLRTSPAGPAHAPSYSAAVSTSPLDPHAIFASIGEVPYDWRIDTDELVWGPNVCGALKVDDPSTIASGRAFAQFIDPTTGPTRFDAVMRSAEPDAGGGVPYQVQYALRGLGASDDLLWLEDTGRWFAGHDGKPARAHGVVRTINERYSREQRLSHLSSFDVLTGAMNWWRLSEVLAATIEEAGKLQSSCGFLLVAIDNLGRINETYGFDVADEVIAAVSKRVRTHLRGKDHLGRFSGNKLGIILNNCTLDDMQIAADRLLVSVRDQVVQTAAGPVAVTVTIGGVTAPRSCAHGARRPQPCPGCTR